MFSTKIALGLVSLLRSKDKGFCFEISEEPETTWLTIYFYSAKYAGKDSEEFAVKSLIPHLRNKAQASFIEWFEPQISNINPHEPSPMDLALYNVKQEGVKLIASKLSEETFNNVFTFSKFRDVFSQLGVELVSMYKTKYEKTLAESGFVPKESNVSYNLHFESL